MNDRVAVVIGSTRPARICPGIAEWVMRVAQEDSPLHYELLDLAHVNLPFLDEPVMAALQRYEHEHTRAWSRTVSSYDGLVFVFPQYNWGYPAALKNALDFLYVEWSGKPATCVTYGTRGGSKAAAQFREVLNGLHMHVLDASWQMKDLDATLQPYVGQARTFDAQMREALLTTSSRPRRSGCPQGR